MKKLSNLRSLLSKAGATLQEFEQATDEQLERLLVPVLSTLKKEITANKKKAAIS